MATVSAAVGANVKLTSPMPITPTLAPGAQTEVTFEVDVPDALPGLTLPLSQRLNVAINTTDNVTASTTFILQILPQPPTTLTVKVVDRKSNGLLPGVLLMIEGNEQTYQTDDHGTAVIPTTAGDHAVYSYLEHFLTRADTATVVEGQANTLIVYMDRGETLDVSDVQATQLTPEQIAARGVVLDDPANQWVYDFVIYLHIGDPIYVRNRVLPKNPSSGSDITFSGGGGGGGVCCWVYGTFHYFASGQHVDTWIIIPGRFHVLKQFWDAKIFIKNAAEASDPNSIIITDIHAILQLPPKGLGLPDLFGNPQNATQVLEPLPAGKSTQASWVVRGDAGGGYLLPALVTGTIQYKGITTTIPLVINARPAELIVYEPTFDVNYTVPSHVTAGVPFTLKIDFINTTPITIYEVSVEILASKMVNAHLASAAVVPVGTMVPGQSQTVDFTIVPELTGCVIIPDSYVTADWHISPI